MWSSEWGLKGVPKELPTASFEGGQERIEPVRGRDADRRCGKRREAHMVAPACSCTRAGSWTDKQHHDEQRIAVAAQIYRSISELAPVTLVASLYSRPSQ